ncbi:hypothetical protein TNCV_3157711 [Trichonephila clavipes]|nr:hypothetical protein TNCV_3157711 [Trichonephila clavipes]
MDAVDFLRHENSLTLAGVEPANMGIQGQGIINYATQLVRWCLWCYNSSYGLRSEPPSPIWKVDVERQ